MFVIKPSFSAFISGTTLNRSNKGEDRQDISALEHYDPARECDSLPLRHINLASTATELAALHQRAGGPCAAPAL
jgi:hypothetical protein